MSAATAHAPKAPPKEEYFRYTNLGPVFFGLLVAFGAGALICVLSIFMFRDGGRQFLFSWLFAFMYFFTIAAGALFWILIHYMMDVEWSVVVRRILETIANSFTVLWIAFIPIALGAGVIYDKWINVAPGTDPAIDVKHVLLNRTAWLVGSVLYLGFFFLSSFVLRRLSTKQDITGDLGCSTRARGVSFASIPFFGVFITFAAIHWVMSITPHWYSTMWGVYLFAGSAWSSMATLIIITYLLRRAGYLQGIVSTEHFHIMGKLLLSFTVFWAYIAFDQFFLIWYANIPEETEFFLTRNTASWNVWAIGLEVIGHFFITFALLLPRVTKTNPKYLAMISGWVLLMHLCDMYFIVNPFLHGQGVEPLTMIVDLAAVVTIGAPLVFVFIQALGRHSLYAIRDPRLPESLRLVN